MIGQLPRTLTVEGCEYPINTDFRDMLVILQALNDQELDDKEKMYVMLCCLYSDNIPANLEEAVKQAVWFLDGGPHVTAQQQNAKKLMDWEQDEQMIFAAVNKVAGCETRGLDYLHWWTFLGYFSEIGEGLFSTVVNIRKKKSRGKKLDKTEEEFYRRNRELITLHEKLTPKESAAMEAVNMLLKNNR